MIKTKKRNHYLPRFYLKGFCDSNSRVWMYDKTNPMHPIDGAPSDMGLIKKLYHLENNENAKDEIENYFEKTVETPASPAFKRLISPLYLRPAACQRDPCDLVKYSGPR